MVAKKISKKTNITKENLGVTNENNNFPEEDKSTRKIRKCLKKEPLQPLNTGTIIRRKSKKATKAEKPKFTAKKSMKSKVIKTKTNNNKAKLQSSKSKTPVQPKDKKIKSTISKPKNVVAIPQITVSDEFDSEVVFNPQSDCTACQEGRKGEGDQTCWACRLSRLLAITEYKLASKENKQQ